MFCVLTLKKTSQCRVRGAVKIELNLIIEVLNVENETKSLDNCERISQSLQT